MSFSALGRLQNNKIAHLQPKFTMCVSLNMYQFKIFTPVTRNQSCWDSDITQKNSIWLSFCSFWGLTTKTSPTQAKVAFNFKTVLLHRKMWASLPVWQIQSNLSQIRWLSQTQSHMLKYIWDNIVDCMSWRSHQKLLCPRLGKPVLSLKSHNLILYWG